MPVSREGFAVADRRHAAQTRSPRAARRPARSAAPEAPIGTGDEGRVSSRGERDQVQALDGEREVAACAAHDRAPVRSARRIEHATAPSRHLVGDPSFHPSQRVRRGRNGCPGRRRAACAVFGAPGIEALSDRLEHRRIAIGRRPHEVYPGTGRDRRCRRSSMSLRTMRQFHCCGDSRRSDSSIMRGINAGIGPAPSSPSSGCSTSWSIVLPSMNAGGLAGAPIIRLRRMADNSIMSSRRPSGVSGLCQLGHDVVRGAGDAAPPAVRRCNC